MRCMHHWILTTMHHKFITTFEIQPRAAADSFGTNGKTSTSRMELNLTSYPISFSLISEAGRIMVELVSITGVRPKTVASSTIPWQSWAKLLET